MYQFRLQTDSKLFGKLVYKRSTIKEQKDTDRLEVETPNRLCSVPNKKVCLAAKVFMFLNGQSKQNISYELFDRLQKSNKYLQTSLTTYLMVELYNYKT